MTSPRSNQEHVRSVSLLANIMVEYFAETTFAKHIFDVGEQDPLRRRPGAGQDILAAAFREILDAPF